ncbi:DUF3300 domain-containing protein [Allitabrizicola rongguiensis]|uniref:DUF3300 domain-containing protein n=1 Tax=Alitabrizicola rongguiensis TaxID=2909234 RepID=UPI001F1A296C|nr:DUF3300 domain-containing protein [Tabrizicola rongguiensis]
MLRIPASFTRRIRSGIGSDDSWFVWPDTCPSEDGMNRLRTLGFLAAMIGTTALTASYSRAEDAASTPQTVAPSATQTTGADEAVDDGLLSADELDELFAPVALYPDALLAQVLLAATYPLDVVKANLFLERNKGKSPKELSDLVSAQIWPEPVKALAAGFPDLIGRMIEHIDWTEMAGNALIAQTDDSLASIQRLRAQAKLNGYLEDNQAMNVEEDPDSGNLTISSASPDIVYVPQYTETVYTTPAPANPVYVTDGSNWDDWLMTGAIVWGGAILIDEIFDDDHWDEDWGDYWHGGGGNGNHIDWDGDINIDNGIDIGNIGNGDRLANIGDRNPGGSNLGDGNLGGAIAGGIAGGVAGGALKRPSTLPAIDKGRLGDVSTDRLDGAKDGNFRPTDASRDAAREKIKTHKATGGNVAALPAARGRGDTAGLPQARPSDNKAKLTKPSAKPKASRPSASAPKVNKPKVSSRPSASSPRASVSRSPSFKPSSGSRAQAASSRGRTSRGGRR